MPIVTYRTPSGQTVTSDLQDAPPQIQSLYNTNYAQVQSQTTSAAAGAAANTVTTQQTQAPQELGTDLKNGMTLGDAMKKYLPLKVDPHDIYKQYLAGNTYGSNGTPKAPIESPEQLINMGVPADALGKIGETGTVQDRWNTGSAIEELRIAKDLWNKTNAANIAGNKLGVDSNSAAYQAAMTILGNHLSSLIPGASGAQATGQSLLNGLPNSQNITSYAPDVANAKFDTVEKMLLAQKKYSYDDVYSKAPTASSSTSAPTKPTTGGGLLNTLLTNSGKEISSMLNPMADLKPTATDTPDQVQAKQKEALNRLLGIEGAAQPQNVAINTVKQLLGIAANPGESFKEHPVNTTAAILGPLLGLKGGMGAEGAATEGEAGATTAEGVSKIPSLKGNPIADFLNPKGIVKRGGNVRNTIIDSATKAGTTIDGDKIVADLNKTASTLKQGNLGQGDVIDQSLKDAEAAFAGKKLTPKEAANAYAEADPGFTKTGTPKSSIQSNIDRNLRDILGNHLEDAAPGWNESTATMAKGFKAAKSPVRPFVKRSAEVGLGLAGLDQLRHILGI